MSGSKFAIHQLSSKELMTNGLVTKWCPRMEHPAFPKDKIEQFSKMSTEQAMKGIVTGAWNVPCDWNKLLPEFRFTDPEKFLGRYWKNGN